jgi:transcriptional regulator with XRE-family HTH domain
MTDLKALLAANMKVYRGAIGLSQAKLANLIDTAPNYIALIETGKRFPSPRMLERIADALGVDSTQLFSKKPAAEEEFIKAFRDHLVSDIDQVIAERLKELRGI